MEKEKTTPDNARERKNFVLAPKAKETKFVVEVITRKVKKTKATFTYLGVTLVPNYIKEIRLENDEKGLVVTNGTHRKYTAVLCDGVSSETGNAYIGLDIQIDELYRKRDFLTWAEKIMLAKAGLLVEQK
ncbi:MAG: hypothetical protein FWC00_03455 [Firmicutes bacterium]|nr:hypothetical protein [Bacillota bacterium]